MTLKVGSYTRTFNQIINFLKIILDLLLLSLEREKPKCPKNLFFGNLIHSHNRDHFIGDIQLHGPFNLNFWTFRAKKESNVWSLKRPTFTPRPSWPSFPVFKTKNKLKWYSGTSIIIMNRIYITKSSVEQNIFFTPVIVK